MENNVSGDSPSIPPVRPQYALAASILVSALILAGAWTYSKGPRDGEYGTTDGAPTRERIAAGDIEGRVLPARGVALPIRWGDLGARMVSVGVIDGAAIERLYAARGGLTDEMRKLLYEGGNGDIVITRDNSGFLLNLLWALGMGSKNDILERGEMADPHYGGAGNFASTAGWSAARGGAMEHYSRHRFVVLTPREQELVERVSKGIFRPCCDNAAHFPDCNHGMAMLGLLELMASQGVSEQDMWKAALAVNSYWFPEAYVTVADYLQSNGVAWESADPKELLGRDFSSASGYRRIVSQMAVPSEKKPSGGCAA